MARGITESDVHGAADALVAAGERPTVERVRAHLGTGSPNTVVRWLETWWQGLGERLATDRQARIAAANVPDAVAELAGQWWMLALDQAQHHAEAELANERDALLNSRHDLAQERENWRGQTAELHAQVERAHQERTLAQTRATELERLSGQLQLQIEELTQQRNSATARTVEAEKTRDAVQLRLQELQDAAHLERENQAQHIRAIEDRAHAEVDRARLELKAAQHEIAALRTANSTHERQRAEQVEAAMANAMEARQELAAQRARGDAFEAQLNKLQDLPAAVASALAARKPTPSSKGRRPRQATTATPPRHK